MVFNPGQPQVLIGKFVYGAFDTDLEDELVEIWARVSCDSWVKLGASLTTTGNAGTVAGVPDDGGRVFFVVPQERALPAGTYPIRMLVKGDHSVADCTLAVWEQGTRVVVSDIDGTLTTSEYDGLWTAFSPSSPDPNPSAPDVFWWYAKKGYRILYLTARPEFLLNGTRAWFQEQGFPKGLFHLVPNNTGAIGDGATEYKAGYLKERVANQALIFDWAYGNKNTDLAAYLQAEIAPSHIYLFLYDGELMGAHRLADYADEIPRVKCLPPASQP